MTYKVNSAIISVYDKTGLERFATFLQDEGVRIISTGGTANYLKERGIKVTEISDYTSFPEIMDGRVKTLHPKIHGGLLAVRDKEKHKNQAEEHGIPSIDMVVCNLYPFSETVASGAEFDECIENIDIGGPSMIRSAAKNHKYVTVITDPDDYETVITEMQAHGDVVAHATRKKLAAKAFAKTAYYDSAISGWFAGQQIENFPKFFTLSGSRKELMRYGENPHQQAALYCYAKGGIADANQLQGKELSYNNMCDADAALDLISEFDKPAVAIVKHANPCGVATADTLGDAYEKAHSCDPTSAYGSIIAVNKEIDHEMAEKLAKLFVEVVIAPEVTIPAQQILSKKKKMRLLVQEMPDKSRKALVIKNLYGGFLLQERDSESVTEADFEIVTKRKPDKEEIKDMIFAFTVCKHVKSNAILFAKDGQTVGIGAGQMSRVDSVKIAAIKAAEGEVNRAEGAVMASDAFMPFADGLEIAAKAGIKAVIQPGGSIRDKEVIDAADKHGIAMVFTGKRHFRH